MNWGQPPTIPTLQLDSPNILVFWE